MNGETLQSTEKRYNQRKNVTTKETLQEGSIPVGCVPATCPPYVFQWPPLDVSSSTGRSPGLMSGGGENPTT